jgi:ketosteroid isomerase-like protein
MRPRGGAPTFDVTFDDNTGGTIMPTDTIQQIEALGHQFAEAQVGGDPAALDRLLADEFKLVGPLGFVLDKQQWLAQYRSGALVTHSVDWDEVDVRDFGAVAIAIGRHAQRAQYAGHPADGTFRVTQIALERDGEWVLVGLHFSPIAQPPAGGGAPSSG